MGNYLKNIKNIKLIPVAEMMSMSSLSLNLRQTNIPFTR